MSVKLLVEMSNKYGSNPEYVLAGGGNTSYKDENYLYIKGSGTQLATITESGFVKMDRKSLAKMWTKTYSEDNTAREAEVLEDLMDSRCKEDRNKRPSVETMLHNLFPTTFVLHIHPPMVNGITCSNTGEDIVAKLFDGKAVWIPATKPGYILSLVTKQAMDKYAEVNGSYPNVLFIENHGIFFSGNTLQELDTLTADVFGKIKSAVKREPDFSAVEFDSERVAKVAPAIRMALKDGNNGSIIKFIVNKEVARLASDYEQYKSVKLSFTPDHIVYCKHTPLFIKYVEDIEAQRAEAVKAIADYTKTFGNLPKIIFLEKAGFFACGKNKKEADIAGEVFLDEIKIAVYAESFGGHQFMSKEDIDFIRNWEVESYRQSVSLAGGSAKRLFEKVAIVTGAAQGFGKGIAEEMAGQGAYVVIADLNYDGAVACAKEICEKHGEGKAIAVKVDAGDEVSVKAMFNTTVFAYGGLDIFVNNAGIVKAGSLDEMEVATLDLVTKINYTAYFLGAKYASKIMKIQQQVKPELFFDIIQINSKSGLAGSNKNFAYAGSKFGGIGLTQSFALELAPYNIKVNSVCPGNFLDGPLWCDPEKGLFVQYLKAGKVPGAKTVADVKKFYESKVPLNRGCRVIDVVNAIYYIVDQEYETGQAVPVTGGQEMLK